MTDPLEELQAETARKLVVSLREELAEAKAALEIARGVLQAEADCLVGDHRGNCVGFTHPGKCDCDGPDIRRALAPHPGPESREQAEPAPSGSIPPAGPSGETAAAAVRCCRTCGKPGCSNPTHDQSIPPAGAAPSVPQRGGYATQDPAAPTSAEPPVTCSCGEEFTTPRALWDHYQQEGEPEETFKCKTCGKVVPNADGADDDMPDSCSDCWLLNDLHRRVAALESSGLAEVEVAAVRTIINERAGMGNSSPTRDACFAAGEAARVAGKGGGK